MSKTMVWLLVGMCCLSSTVCLGTWRYYDFYEPEMTHSYVVPPTDSRDYHHAPALAYFDGKWIALWNANWEDEGDPNQAILMTTSTNLSTWSTNGQNYMYPFSSYTRSTNPVPFDGATQWQPILCKTSEDELMCCWRQLGGNANYEGLWISTLTDVDGQWTNTKIFNKWVTKDSQGWNLIPGTNGVKLLSGRILFPVTMHDWGSHSRNSVVYSDDGGSTWELSSGASIYGDDTNPNCFEPIVWELPDEPNTVLMLARNNDTSQTNSARRLFMAQSFDGGETWSNLVYCPIQSHRTRGHVVRRGCRNIMLHHDYPNHRLNIALFTTRGDFDFIAGPSITEAWGDTSPYWVHYPQFAEDDSGNVVAIWSHSYAGDCPPDCLLVTQISAMPSESSYYLMPRDLYGSVYRGTPSNHIVFTDDVSSAGVELDENYPDSDYVYVHIRFKVFNGSKNTLMTLGHPGCAAKIFADNGRVILKEWDGTSSYVDCGAYSDWTNLDVRTGQGTTRVSVNEGTWYEVDHEPIMNLVFIGDGIYSDTTVTPDTGYDFRIDLNALRTQVD